MSSKFKEYARSRTSIANKNSPSPRWGSIKVPNAIGNINDDVKNAGYDFVNDVKRGYGITAEDEAEQYMNKSLTRFLDNNLAIDARSGAAQFAEIVSGTDNQIALINNLSMINALPPIPDNIVDPPPIWEKNMIKKDLDSWSSQIIGRDYLQRVLARGQFLILVPLDIQPKLLGNYTDLAANKAKKLDLFGFTTTTLDSILTNVNSRINNTSYGLTAKVNSLKYYKAVNAHMKAAMLSLGIDLEKPSTADRARLIQYLPNEIVDRLLGEDSGIMESVFSNFRNKGNNDDSQVITDADAKQSSVVDRQTEPFRVEKVDTAADLFVRKASLNNLIKFITNIDENDDVIKTLPFSIFYCNGPIEKGMSTSSNMSESAIAAMTTDVGSKFMNLASAKSSTAAQIISGQSEDYIKEMAYHRNLGSFLVSNTYIPNVIKSSMIDFQYSVNIRDVAVSSDRYSIVRLFYTLSQLFPFVIQTNEPDQALVVPSAPMYCAAFSKGIMNLPRAAITSMNIKTSPEFQTTEGIPTELDITINIQPLFSQSTMPNFDKFYDGNTNPQYLAAALFNPLSSFNIIATMCGQNTILTKFQAGLISFFLVGTLTTFFSNIANTGNVIAGAWQDWWSSAGMMRNEVYSRTRILGY